MASDSDILVLRERIAVDDLRRLVSDGFGDMVKFVADLDRGWIAIGGQMHADAEHVLLDLGSVQESLWGANYYPGRGADGCLEYTSLINIRPAQGNPSMVVADPAIRERLRELAFRLIGSGEEL